MPSTKVRAKFKVDNVYPNSWGTTSVVMSPVYSSDPKSENKNFWDATPAGSVILYIVNASTVEFFKKNKEYYIDFIPT